MQREYRYYTLENGLRVVLHPFRGIPQVCINVAYHVGSKDEPAGRTGFAHLFEHLMFNGSRNVPRGQYDRLCEMAGGQNNAYTNKDKTSYHITLPSHQLELGLWLESDRLAALEITEVGLETQKHVVVEEKKQREDNQPYGSFETKLVEALFHGHPYGHPVIGYEEDVLSASMEDVREFHQSFYVPSNAVLVIAGDFEPDEAEDMVERYFGPIPTSDSRQRPAGPLRPLGSSPPAVIRDSVPLPGVFMGIRIAPEREKGFIASDLLMDILGNGWRSRLHHTLVYQKRIASQASAYVDPGQEPGMAVMYAIAASGHTADELQEAIETELVTIVREGVMEAESNRTRHRVEASHYRNVSVAGEWADRLAHAALFYDDPSYAESILSRYLECPVEELHQEASVIFREDNRFSLHYEPA